jgi:hypothetical protein
LGCRHKRLWDIGQLRVLFGDRFGISVDELVNRMGGSP